MTSQILIALIGVFAALAGTTIGSISTYFANKNLKKKEWELNLIKVDIEERKNLYSEFLAECYIHLLAIGDEKYDVSLSDLTIVHRYFSKIELISNEKTIEAAKNLVGYIVYAYAKKENEVSFGRLKGCFIDAVKLELKAIKLF